MDKLIIIFCTIISIELLIIGFIVFKLLNNKDKKEVVVKPSEIEKIKLLLEDKSLDKINDFIDGLIKEPVDRYMLLNVNWDADAYMNEQLINEMSLYVFGSIKQCMTPTMVEFIGLIHDVSTEDKLDEYLKLRIKMYIIAVVLKTNQ